MNNNLILDNLLTDNLILSLDNDRDLIVSWHFFEIVSPSINSNDKISNITIKKKYKNKLVKIIQYDKNIVKLYNKEKNKPISKEYFKRLGSDLLKDEKLDINNFKTFPISIFKNLVIIGIIFINQHTTNYNISPNILYKKTFLVNIDKTITRFNNINIIKGIINSSINKEFLEDSIVLINDFKTIFNPHFNIKCSLLYLLNKLQTYCWIFEYK
jgi:hypothetical protein